MSSLGVPGALLPLVIATEVLGALAIIVGWRPASPPSFSPLFPADGGHLPQ